MNILFLEDDDEKFEQVSAFVQNEVEEANVRRVKNWFDYALAITNAKFDLILLDLIVPRSPKDDRPENHSDSLVETTRAYDSKSFFTPAIVLTRQSVDEGDFYQNLNDVDINVIPFNEGGRWREALRIKLLASKPAKKFDVVIICALQKEADAYEGLADTWGTVSTIAGLNCREIQIGEYKAVIVVTNRMGLVSAAVASSFALERFEPKLICMSGICGGVKDETHIYEILVSQVCHQHDAGKWSNAGFKKEHYDIQVDVPVHNKIVELASDTQVLEFIRSNLNPKRSEFPMASEEINCSINPRATTSSGSAVLAEEGQTASLSSGQRKLNGFDMEVYSLYEAARNAGKRTAFFAAKTVVDDGDQNKGDSFHRIGCLISAKFVTATIRAGMPDVL